MKKLIFVLLVLVLFLSLNFKVNALPEEDIITPEEAISKIRSKGRFVSVELKEEEIKVPDGVKGFIGATKLIYNVRTVEEKRALGLIPISMNVDTKVDAETGDVITEVKPWWSFLFDIFKRR